MNIVETYRAGQTGRQGGRIYAAREGLTSPQEIYLPYGLSRSRFRASRQRYRNRMYVVGGHNENIIIDEHRRSFRQGLPRPSAAPAVSVGAGTTIQSCAVAFHDSLTDEWGPLSKAIQVTGNITRAWSSLPTSTPEEDVVLEGKVTLGSNTTNIVGLGTRFNSLRPGDMISLSSDATRWAIVLTITDDQHLTVNSALLLGTNLTVTVRVVSRVDQIGLFVSVAGQAYRESERRQIGVTALTESVATLALGFEHPDSTVPFTRLPKATMSTIFHDRQIVAGDQKHRDTAYLSALTFPERWEGLSIKTRNGEPITSIVGLRDMCLICTANTSYILTGYTEDDLEVTVSEYELGSFNHAAVILVHGNAWVPNNKGYFMFNGAWQDLMRDRSNEWRRIYLAHRLPFENGFAVHNPNDQTVQFHPEVLEAQPAESWIAYYGDMLPQVGGSSSLPDWTNDDHVPDSAAYLLAPNTGVGNLYRGRCDGKVYVENPDTIFQGEAVVRFKHLLFEDPGGLKVEGKKLSSAWSYVEADWPSDDLNFTSEWEVQFWAGDEFAADFDSDPAILDYGTNVEPSPHWKKVVLASQKIAGIAPHQDGYWQPKVRHSHMRISHCSGMGFTPVYKMRNARRWTLRGLGGIILPGLATRRLRGYAVTE